VPTLVLTSAADVHRTLGNFDLTVDILAQAASAGHLMLMFGTENDAPFIPGTTGWGRALRTLRDLTCYKEPWRKDDPGGLSLTINDRCRIAIVVATGDELTGNPANVQPHTKYPKGARTAAAVEANAIGDLFPDTLTEARRKRPETFTYEYWWLLLRFTPSKIFSELSYPSKMEHGWITQWQVRIILPDIEPDPSKLKFGPDDFAPDFDPAVRRIG
jgi:hypothetical protein